MSDAAWQFWVDVGGTFTDCLARAPDGRILRHKVLSSGVVKGAVAAGSTARAILDPRRAADRPGLWDGYTLRLVSPAGAELASAEVAAFDPSGPVLQLAAPLAAPPEPGLAYELVSGEDSVTLAIRGVLGLPRAAQIPPVVVRLGTTRGTNALLERRGARTALVTTRGFADILRIGYQNRPRLFELAVRKPPPVFAAVAEIDERLAADGAVLTPLDRAPCREALAALRAEGIESLAICLLHGYREPRHERIVAEIAAELGFTDLSLSHEVAPLVKLVARGDTTVVDAYLNPVLRGYVGQLRQSLGASSLRLMTSAGGLVRAEEFRGKDSVLSGPAGGVVGFSRAAVAAGFPRAIGFDMGGTSTDVSRFDGRYELEYETEKAGVRIVAPTLAIETVAAGGGSICGFDGVKLVVGPQSAGADPGPACYGRGGPLAVTDLNVYLGRILPERFPFPLDRAAIERRLAELAARVRAAGTDYAPVALCEGLLRVANANMVEAIRSISVAKGADPRDYVLVAFGGAAGQHACAVARELGIQRVLNHPQAGVLSAWGIGLADVSRHRAQGLYRPYAPAALAELPGTFAALVEAARAEVLAEGIAAERIEVRRALDLRYRGLDAWLTIPEPADGDYAAAYAEAHRRLYGYVHADRPLEIVASRVEVLGRGAPPDDAPQPAAPRAAVPQTTATVYFAGQACQAAVFDRETLAPGDWFRGPAIVGEAVATTVVEPGWRAEVLPRGELLLTDEAGPPREQLSTAADPVMLEVFNRQFAGIAEQMGLALRNTASSVNVKERLDFSCAVFTAAGELVVNAPHIPVHLGAMGETVRAVVREVRDLRPGDVLLTNDPFRGGSHLPDITVITPVFDPRGSELRFFTASRAHHAEIGGIRPGSMPPGSKNLAEEGVLLRFVRLVAAGRSCEDDVRRLLTAGPYPSRNVADNLADLAAQAAANRQGVRDLDALVERYGWPVVRAYMDHIRDAAARKVRAALGRLRPGRREFADYLDDGTRIAVTVTIDHAGPDGPRATLDFTGTDPVVPTNLNANRAIVTAAVMYVLRLLIDEDIPLNEGVLAPVELILPECLLNPREGPTPETTPAVVGGNVETSQRVVDVLLGALELAAASQGTMNNLLFGDATFGYYETICGGSGATSQAPGADAVQVHMTNTRLTDPEVLELRYPVRVREFAIRRGSGGTGRHAGGCGVRRRIEFLRPVEVSLLAERRGPFPPYGLAGGRPGALGRQALERADGSRQPLPGRVEFLAAAGDVLEIETPGGGGYGPPAEEPGAAPPLDGS